MRIRCSPCYYTSHSSAKVFAEEVECRSNKVVLKMLDGTLNVRTPKIWSDNGWLRVSGSEGTATRN